MGSVRSTLRAATEAFSAYLKAELIRNRGAFIGAASLMIWMLLFLTPVKLFSTDEVNASLVAARAFSAVLVFLTYTVATWDWAWELRWLNYQGVLEYVISSGRSIFVLYLGLIPVSLLWFAIALACAYAMISLFIAVPRLSISSPFLLFAGFSMLVLVLFAYSMILGAVIITSGSAGPIMEFLGWILPIATGGLAPLINLPPLVRAIALATPFSYPAELIRYALSVSDTVLKPYQELIIGTMYSALFLLVALAVFKLQFSKLLREGIKSVALH